MRRKRAEMIVSRSTELRINVIFARNSRYLDRFHLLVFTTLKLTEKNERIVFVKLDQKP